MSFKTIGLQIRKDGLSHQDYVRHWLTVHAPLGKQVPGLIGYLANEVVLAGDALDLPRSRPEFGATLDGVAQLYFETKEGLGRVGETPEGQALFADGPNFVGVRTGFIAEERTIYPVRRAGRPLKAICFYRGAIETLDAAADWGRGCDSSGLVASRLVEMTGSVNLPGFDVPELDLVLETWAEDEQSAVNSARAIRAALAERAELVGALITREHVIREPAE